MQHFLSFGGVINALMEMSVRTIRTMAIKIFSYFKSVPYILSHGQHSDDSESKEKMLIDLLTNFYFNEAMLFRIYLHLHVYRWVFTVDLPFA